MFGFAAMVQYARAPATCAHHALDSGISLLLYWTVGIPFSRMGTWPQLELLSSTCHSVLSPSHCSSLSLSSFLIFDLSADPNLLDTLEAYDGTVDFLKSLELDKDALTKAIIGTMGDLDAYQLPDAKGYTALSR